MVDRGRSDAVLAFDVNETLLDLRALDPVFDRAFGSAPLRTAWFQQVLQLAFVGGLTGEYVDFTTAQRAALRVLAARTGRTLARATRRRSSARCAGCRRTRTRPKGSNA